MAFFRASIFAAILLVAFVHNTVALRCQVGGGQTPVTQQDCPSGQDACMSLTAGDVTAYTCSTMAICTATPTPSNGSKKCCNTNLCTGGSSSGASLATMSVLAIPAAVVALKYL